jgi:hypothetical protein
VAGVLQGGRHRNQGVKVPDRRLHGEENSHAWPPL